MIFYRREEIIGLLWKEKNTVNYVIEKSEQKNRTQIRTFYNNIEEERMKIKFH